MKFLATLGYFALAMSTTNAWSLTFRKHSCAIPGTDDITGTTAGKPDDEFCYMTNRDMDTHSIYANGIQADDMTVAMFTDTKCKNFVQHFDTDGCKIAPQEQTIGSIAVTPRSKLQRKHRVF